MKYTGHKLGSVLSLSFILNILPIHDILKNKRYKASIEQQSRYLLKEYRILESENMPIQVLQRLNNALLEHHILSFTGTGLFSLYPISL